MRSLLLACLTLLLAAPAAQASCVSGIVSGGRFLVEQQVRHVELPEDGEVDAVFPGCNDSNGSGAEEPDVPTKATKLRGLPADVAVRERRGLFVAPGTLTAVRGHPLRDAVDHSLAHRGRRCGRERLRGPARVHANHVVLIGRRGVIADRRTRITNRPAYAVVEDGQRLEIAVSHCGRRRFADTIAFVGAPPPPPQPRDASPLLPLALLLVAGAIGIVAVRRA